MLARQSLNVAKLLRSARSPTLRPAPIRNASKKSPFVDGGARPNMNDLPVPEGDWSEAYARRNLKNTIILMIGIGMFTTSLYMHLTDESINWNFKVPEYDRCS